MVNCVDGIVLLRRGCVCLCPFDDTTPGQLLLCVAACKKELWVDSWLALARVEHQRPLASLLIER